MPQLSPNVTLPAVRVVIGAGAYASPPTIGTVFGFANVGDEELAYLTRLFGIRDLMLGVGSFAARGEARRLWLKLGIACDLADAVAGVIGFRAGAPKLAMTMATTTALLATGLGIAALNE